MAVNHENWIGFTVKKDRSCLMVFFIERHALYTNFMYDNKSTKLSTPTDNEVYRQHESCCWPTQFVQGTKYNIPRLS